MVIDEKEMDRIDREMTILVERMMELGCDACRVFVSAINRDNDTVSLTKGDGNFHAQVGLTSSWVRRHSRPEVCWGPSREGYGE